MHARGLRLATTSRPGYGASSRQPGRSVADVTSDIDALLDALHAERCLIAGWSGGGPHALACAARVSRAAGALIIAGVAPFTAQDLDWMTGMGEENLVEFGTALQSEVALRRYLEPEREDLRTITAAGIVSSLATILPEVDRAVISDEFGEDFAAGFHEAVRLGVDGWLDDDLAFTKDWGFSLNEISIPIMLWQGDLDLMVPFSHGKWLSSQLPGAKSHLQHGEGHLSIGVGALERMLDELIATALSG